jgi:hypothetical protein
MLRRAGIVLTASMAFLALWAGVAQALCPIAQFDGVLRSSDGVWWATVTKAEVSQSGSPGYWTFKVDIHDSLKGPGVDGGTGTVYFSVCGPFLSQQGKREAAEGFVGQTMLFMGRDHDGGLVSGSLFFRPNLQPPAAIALALWAWRRKAAEG